MTTNTHQIEFSDLTNGEKLAGKLRDGLIEAFTPLFSQSLHLEGYGGGGVSEKHLAALIMHSAEARGSTNASVIDLAEVLTAYTRREELLTGVFNQLKSQGVQLTREQERVYQEAIPLTIAGCDLTKEDRERIINGANRLSDERVEAIFCAALPTQCCLKTLTFAGENPLSFPANKANELVYRGGARAPHYDPQELNQFTKAFAGRLEEWSVKSDGPTLTPAIELTPQTVIGKMGNRIAEAKAEGYVTNGLRELARGLTDIEFRYDERASVNASLLFVHSINVAATEVAYGLSSPALSSGALKYAQKALMEYVTPEGKLKFNVSRLNVNRWDEHLSKALSQGNKDVESSGFGDLKQFLHQAVQAKTVDELRACAASYSEKMGAAKYFAAQDARLQSRPVYRGSEETVAEPPATYNGRGHSGGGTMRGGNSAMRGA